VALPPSVESVAGAQELHDWFGYWPDFHDAEVKELRVELGQVSRLVLHTWEMTDKVTAEGFYETRKHVRVELIVEDITRIELGDLWENSILLSLKIDKTESGFLLELSAAYGLYGSIEAGLVSLRVVPTQSGHQLDPRAL
jgi:Immunity protein 50